MAKSKLIIVLSLASGLALALSLPFFSWGWLSFFAFIPLFLVLASLKNQSQAFKTGYLAGLVYFAFTFRWFWDTYPLSALGVESHLLAFFLILPVWLLTALGMALFWGGAAWLVKKTEPRFNWTALLIVPSIFTFAEYLRSFFLSLLWFAPGTALGPHWTLGNIAYALSNSPTVLYLSSLIGIYGLTFLILFLNTLFFLFLEQRRPKIFLLTASLVLITAYFPWLNLTSSFHQPSIQVAIIQTANPSQTSSTKQGLSAFKKQLELLNQVGQQWPETHLVVFPEGSNFFSSLSLFGDALSTSQYFDRLFPSSTVILDHNKIRVDDHFESKTIYVDSKEGVRGFYDKYLLTPVGEFIPSLIKQLDHFLALDSRTVQQAEWFRKGTRYPPTFSSPLFSFRPLVCSDLVSPLLSRTSREEPPDLLTVQANLGFVHGSRDTIRQTKAMARFRAAENKRSLVFSANFGPSFMLAPSGAVVQESPKAGFEILTGTLVLNKNRTLYNRIGDGPIIMASLSVLMLSFFWRERKK